MSDREAAASGPIARLKQLSQRIFVDREVFLRSNDRVQYLRISARAQKLMAGVAAVATAWLTYTTLAYFLSTYLERAKDAEIAQHRLAAGEAQLLDAQVAHRVRPGIFAGQTALIVGGSRGLGEVTAKLIAAGGGTPIITYQAGKSGYSASSSR